ncbi:MAG TPA: PQQ-binding-like beta-propeller repeat protein [Solirubrobacteraceae bacterium]|nr:PQQ-binding-like beta-propeller repeat protein [Solirubrobacteraceae bacterium]
MATLATAAFGAAVASAQSWPSWGHDLANSRSQPLESILNPGNVGELTRKWAHLTAGYVSATPAVAGGIVYFPDSAGYLYALNATTGTRVWRTRISTYDGIAKSVSRVSPVVWGNYLILGDRGDNSGADQSVSARVFAVDRFTGRLVWMTQVSSHHAAQITASPVVAKNLVIVAVSSNEEGDAELASYPCCTFRGSVVALSARTGAIRWTTYMVPPNSGPCTGNEPGIGPVGCGYSGAAVWGSPAVDTKTGQVFVGTGNDYTTPDSATACQEAAMSSGTSDANCTAPDDYFDAVVAMKLSNGKVEWGHKVEGWDASNLACDNGPPGATWCPSITSPDYDFGDSPNIMQITGAKGKRETVVGIGQKSGVYWTLDAATGRIVWNSLVGPGGGLGGIVWGTAYDGQRIYVPLSNSDGTAYDLGGPGGPPASGGSWAALDPQTGAFDWQVATPGAAAAYGPASVANGVVYVGDMAPSGDNMFALDAATGKTLWSFAAAGSVNASPAIVDGTLYWGSGYGALEPSWTGSHVFYAFGLPNKS